MPEALCSWRALLLRIGDKCSEYGGTVDYREHIDTCYGVIWREFDHYRDDILELILQCAEQLPHKIPFYGVLVGLLNLEKEDFAKEIVDNTHSSLQRGLDEGDCNGVRISMRFLTCLMCSNVISLNFIVEIFETLLSSAAIIVDEESGNPSWQARADFYISCILSSLPWGGAELNEQVPEEFDRVLVGVQSYLNIRQRSPDILYSVFDTHCDSGIEGKDFLEDLWDRIQLLSHNGWKADSVPRPYLTFEAQLVSGNAYTLSPINCPHQSPLSLTHSTISREREKHEAELKFPRRLQRLNIFPSNKVEDMEPIDRFVVEEYLLDVLFFFNGCRKECATYLVGLPVPFRYEYLMAETIFSQLLLLPHAPFKSMYYTLVIIDLCKALPGAFPAVVVGAVRSLFEKIDDLDMECRSRLVLWFSHHLANFQYVWPWEEWAYVKDLPKWAPQRIFVQEILEREIRLCYFEKIKQSIENAPALEELLPPKGSPCFKYSTIDSNNQELSDGQKLSSELNNMIKARKNSREITQWMDENIITSHGREFAAEIVIQTLMDIGSKSFTHLITALERYGQVISKLSFELEMQVFVINVITSYWKNSAQMAAIAIDRMMGYRLISNMAIVNWVFSEPNVGEFHLSYRPWEILRNTINKTFNRISDLRKEIKALEKGILLAEEASEKAQKEYEFAERKLEVVDGQPVQAERPGRLKRLKAYAEKAKSEESSIRESREAKEALLVRALEENKVLFISLYKNFKYVLMERLPLFSPDGKLPNLKVQKDIMSVDLEKVPKMEVDHENGNSDDRNTPDGERSTGSYSIGEVEQWCLTTLGHLKAISRQYSTEIWPHIEVVDAEIFNEEIHPLFKKAVYDGLGRSDQ